MTGPSFFAIDERLGNFLGSGVVLLVSGAGLVFLGLHGHHTITHDKPFLSFVTGVVLPAIGAMALVYLGGWAARRDLKATYLARLTIWSFLGATAMAVAGGLIVIHEFFAGRILHDAPYLVVNSATGGMLGGFIVGLFEIKNRRQRDRLTSINEAMGTLMHLQSKEDVCEHVVSVAAEHLDMPITGIWLVDPEDDERLEPVATVGLEEFDIDEPPVYGPDNGLSWEAFARGESMLISDLSSHDTVNPETRLKREMIRPLGRFGVLNVGSFEDSGFDEVDRLTATVLARSTTEALERTDREERLREQHEELDRRAAQLEGFTRAISHDLRNPLTVAEGHLELYGDTGDPHHIDRVQASLDRMDSIIEDILWLADEGRSIGDRRSVSLATVARDAWQFVDTGAGTLDIDTDAVLEADPDRLQQAFENFFRNATEHGGDTVAVRIGTMPNGFYVEDDGPGIPPDDRERVFAPGFTTHEAGTGFGLSIVEEIVRAHEWEIAVTNGPSGGARFEVTNVTSIEKNTAISSNGR